MKETNDMTDIHLAQVFGEALGDAPSPEETLSAWEAFEKKHAETAPLRKVRYRMIGAAMAAIAVAAAIFVFVFKPSKEVDSPVNPLELYAEVASPSQVEQTMEDGRCRVSTPAATTTLVTLEDGTKVMLNANSSIEYPRSFADAEVREVELKGEAHFEVTKNPHRPFVVTAGNMKTQVLGTVFDVKAYRKDSPKVTLMEGHVKVSNQETSIDMRPGQTVTLHAEKLIVSKSLQNEGKDWLTGDFDMEQASLAEAMGDIGSWYNKTVIFQSKRNMDKQIHFRFSRKASLEEVVTALNELKIAKIELREGKVVVE